MCYIRRLIVARVRYLGRRAPRLLVGGRRGARLRREGGLDLLGEGRLLLVLRREGGFDLLREGWLGGAGLLERSRLLLPSRLLGGARRGVGTSGHLDDWGGGSRDVKVKVKVWWSGAVI